MNNLRMQLQTTGSVKAPGIGDQVTYARGYPSHCVMIAGCSQRCEIRRSALILWPS